MKIINKRGSIRRYQDKAIEKNIIDDIIRAAMNAPSAGNEQPWEFVVVD